MPQYRPLADIIRPKTLDEVVGQSHILGSEGLLRRVVESGKIPNMIFYGPSGTGKTTVAQIIADAANRSLRKLNATTAGIADIRAIIDELDTLLTPNGVLLYLDEIQYFNKKQQQSLLEFIENGKITLIASTTENPYFYVFNAILSRSTVFEFKPLTREDAIPAVTRAIRLAAQAEGLAVAEPGEAATAEAVTETPPARAVTVEDGVEARIAEACGGDVRKAVNAVELLFAAAPRDEAGLRLTLADAKNATQRSSARYDRGGDEHYDLVSALQKSIRGSDPNAALHYLARLLEAGDLISPCRRLLVIAAEDIGLAYPLAIPFVKACVDSATQLGLPEARIPLADAAVLLATAPKSNSAYLAIDRALHDVRSGGYGAIPRELQNKHADGAGFEREQGYLYPHDYKNHWTAQQYLPDAIKDVEYYEYGENKNEQSARRYWDEVKGKV